MEATGASGWGGSGCEGRSGPSPAEVEPATRPQSWAQAGCRYGGGKNGVSPVPQRGEWAGLPPLLRRLRGPAPPEEVGANQSQMWAQCKKR